MFRSILFFLLFIFFSFCGFSQNYYPDKIYTKKGVIDCRITDIKDSLIFYRYKKQEWNMHSHARLDSIESYYWVSKNTKEDSASLQNDSVKQALLKIKGSIWSHTIGIGAQLLSPTNLLDGHTEYLLQYKPSLFFIYRFLHTNENLSRTGLTLNTSYRSGYISQTRGSNAVSGTTSGNFDVIRMDCGFNHFFPFGGNRNSSFGVGCYFGGIISATGNFDYHGHSSSTGVTLDIKNYQNAYQMINHAYGGISFELQTQLNISESKYFLIGIRALIESRETLDARLGKIIGIFIGYRFGKKPKN